LADELKLDLFRKLRKKLRLDCLPCAFSAASLSRPLTFPISSLPARLLSFWGLFKKPEKAEGILPNSLQHSKEKDTSHRGSTQVKEKERTEQHSTEKVNLYKAGTRVGIVISQL
jgi:hypothetical protein